MINVYRSRIKSNLKISKEGFIEDYLKNKLLYLREYVDLRDRKSASISVFFNPFNLPQSTIYLLNYK